MWGFLQFTKYLWLVKFNLFGLTFFGFDKRKSYLVDPLYLFHYTWFWRHESTLLIHLYFHTITRSVKMINRSNVAMHYLSLGQLLYILVFPYTWGWVSKTYPIWEGKYTYEHIIIYYFILMLILEMHKKNSVKIYVSKFWKITIFKIVLSLYSNCSFCVCKENFK